MTCFFSKGRIRSIWAITKKDLRIAFRFPKNFVATQLITPLRQFVLFLLIYQSFFIVTQNQPLGYWSRSNYIPSLLLSSIFNTSFQYAYYRFRSHFIREKYWKTIQLFLTAPLSKLDFLIGSIFALAIELSISIICYLALFQLLHPVSFLSFLLISGSLFLMLFGVLGVGLMQGAISISNENYLFVFDYLYAGWFFFSCFYYADSALPAAFRFLVKVNPIYHAIEIARGTIFHHLSSGQTLGSLAYLLFFSSTVPFLGAFFFRKVVSKLGVRGF